MHSRLFGCLTKLGAKRDELVQKFVPRSRAGIFRNKHTQSTPLDPKLSFCCISYYLSAIGLFGCLTKLGAIRAELMQKFMPRSCVGIFRYERTRSTPLDPKLIFWVHFVLFGCIWDRLFAYGSRCKTGQTSAKVRATKSHRNVSQRTHPIYPHWTLN